jgi:hypothetical protein
MKLKYRHLEAVASTPLAKNGSPPKLFMGSVDGREEHPCQEI